MIWPFSKKGRPDSEEIRQAQAARARATTAATQVEGRAEEVQAYYVRLHRRRIQNNFGAALAAAMERR